VGCATGEAKEPPLRPIFDRRIKLEFHGARITSDGGLLTYRELDHALGLTDMAITKLLDRRRGRNTRHKLIGLFRQAVYFLDTDRIARDVAYQTIILGELLKYGKQIIIKGRDYVNNPENKFTVTVLGAVAELERAKMIERTTRVTSRAGSREKYMMKPARDASARRVRSPDIPRGSVGGQRYARCHRHRPLCSLGDNHIHSVGLRPRL
jgi:hypothetical protein